MPGERAEAGTGDRNIRCGELRVVREVEQVAGKHCGKTGAMTTALRIRRTWMAARNLRSRPPTGCVTYMDVGGHSKTPAVLQPRAAQTRRWTSPIPHSTSWPHWRSPSGARDHHASQNISPSKSIPYSQTPLSAPNHHVNMEPERPGTASFPAGSSKNRIFRS